MPDAENELKKPGLFKRYLSTTWEAANEPPLVSDEENKSEEPGLLRRLRNFTWETANEPPLVLDEENKLEEPGLLRRLRNFTWDVDHIAAHGIEPEEVEDVCFGQAMVLRAKSEGKNPVYYVLGQTSSGRYLFCVVIQFPDGKGYPVTARSMNPKERRRYKQWKKR